MADYDQPHIDISARVDAHRYKAPKQNVGGGGAPRVREEHGALLLGQLRAAYQEVQATEPPLEGVERADGAYYEVELKRGAKAATLERRSDHILAGATKIDPETQAVSTVLYVPDDAVPVLERILTEYAEGELSARGQPPNKNFVDPIEEIRRARLLSFWTDSAAALPDNPQASLWWEVWCAAGSERQIANTLERLGCRIADEERWLTFPEVVVVPVFGRRADIEVAIFATGGITELRRASDTPTFFTNEAREDQHEWVQDLAGRTTWPGADVPRVCLLDTGVNRAHVLIEPALAEADLLTANPDWVPTDNVNFSHGTEMAGLALHGDLFSRLQDAGGHALSHRLESVRIMPADGFPPNDLARLGSITLSAVALAEIQNPEHQRTFCLAITNEDRSGDRATSWSACIDRAAFGGLGGDEEDRRRRLFCVSAGNVPPVMEAAQLGEPAGYPIEDPAQAWNALTIGGYTDKIQIDADPAFVGHTPMCAAGEVSPFSRNSLSWRANKTPIKPEVVFEAGNRARSGDGLNLINCPSLELLTTGSETDRLPIVNFAATSAATAQAARLAAQLHADNPEYWPETVRALIVHSARWTPPMEVRLKAGRTAQDRQRLVRTFGYGVPSFVRAAASASNDLALIAQRTIQPFRKGATGVGFNECHYYALPWPARLLQAHGDQQFSLKVTLSYFVEPNPGKSAAIDPQNYQSFGLRFDLKRPTELPRQFRARLNAEEREGANIAPPPADSGWILGANSVAAGSLHCDVWTGTGAQLATRNAICVKPVSGWWKARSTRAVCEQEARYSLVVTLSAPALEIDLYTPIVAAMAEIEQPVDVEVLL